MSLGNTLLLYGVILGLPITAIIGALGWMFTKIWDLHTRITGKIEPKVDRIERGLSNIHDLVAETNHCGVEGCIYCNREEGESA